MAYILRLAPLAASAALVLIGCSTEDPGIAPPDADTVVPPDSAHDDPDADADPPSEFELVVTDGDTLDIVGFSGGVDPIAVTIDDVEDEYVFGDAEGAELTYPIADVEGIHVGDRQLELDDTRLSMRGGALESMFGDGGTLAGNGGANMGGQEAATFSFEGIAITPGPSWDGDLDSSGDPGDRNHFLNLWGHEDSTLELQDVDASADVGDGATVFAGTFDPKNVTVADSSFAVDGATTFYLDGGAATFTDSEFAGDGVAVGAQNASAQELTLEDNDFSTHEGYVLALHLLDDSHGPEGVTVNDASVAGGDSFTLGAAELIGQVEAAHAAVEDENEVAADFETTYLDPDGTQLVLQGVRDDGGDAGPERVEVAAGVLDSAADAAHPAYDTDAALVAAAGATIRVAGNDADDNLVVGADNFVAGTAGDAVGDGDSSGDNSRGVVTIEGDDDEASMEVALSFEAGDGKSDAFFFTTGTGGFSWQADGEVFDGAFDLSGANFAFTNSADGWQGDGGTWEAMLFVDDDGSLFALLAAGRDDANGVLGTFAENDDPDTAGFGLVALETEEHWQGTDDDFAPEAVNLPADVIDGKLEDEGMVLVGVGQWSNSFTDE